MGKFLNASTDLAVEHGGLGQMGHLELQRKGWGLRLGSCPGSCVGHQAVLGGQSLISTRQNSP